MTRAELFGYLSADRHPGFADEVARRVCEENAVAELYRAVTDAWEEVPAAVRHRIRFRGACVLERIWLGDASRFMPFAAVFCRRDFAACTDPGVRRIFAKTMASLLGRYDPSPASWAVVAEAAAQWMLDPRSKPAVRIWAVEVLKRCRRRVGWVAESWDDLLAAVARNASPAVSCRLRRSWTDGTHRGDPGSIPVK